MQDLYHQPYFRVLGFGITLHQGCLISGFRVSLVSAVSLIKKVYTRVIISVTHSLKLPPKVVAELQVPVMWFL